MVDSPSMGASTSCTLVSQAASRTKGFGIHLRSTLRFGTGACIVPSIQCHGHVCRFLTGLACAASFNPFLFTCEAVHCMLVMLCSSHGPHVALQTCKPLPYVSYSLPHAPFLHCPSSVLDHGVHLHRVMHFFTSTMCCGTHQLSSLVNC